MAVAGRVETLLTNCEYPESSSHIRLWRRKERPSWLLQRSLSQFFFQSNHLRTAVDWRISEEEQEEEHSLAARSKIPSAEAKPPSSLNQGRDFCRFIPLQPINFRSIFHPRDLSWLFYVVGCCCEKCMQHKVLGVRYDHFES